ncbi:MAG: putative glycerophosphoryl diester phosphodiesterase 1 [Verrucomicrobiota bacterium]|jgi:glycerophosphoryl diester phosphodiesterase
MSRPGLLHALPPATLLAALLACLAPALARPATGDPSAGTATAGLHRIRTSSSRELQQLLAPGAGPLPFVAAHRGGPRPGFPENCLATFENTLRQTWASLEIDPRLTRDGHLVLHHDPTLERTTTGRGKVSEFTLAELRQLRLKDPSGAVTPFRIPTLDEALEWARGRTLLVLDQKDAPLALRVRKIEEHRAEGYALLIVNSFADARACHALNSNLVMEVMIPTLDKARQFATLGIPWRNVIAFVGHTPPREDGLYEFLHRQGARCMEGTSRNLDRQWQARPPAEQPALAASYLALIQRGADVLETDLPAEIGALLRNAPGAPTASPPFYLHP